MTKQWEAIQHAYRDRHHQRKEQSIKVLLHMGVTKSEALAYMDLYDMNSIWESTGSVPEKNDLHGAWNATRLSPCVHVNVLFKSLFA